MNEHNLINSFPESINPLSYAGKVINKMVCGGCQNWIDDKKWEDIFIRAGQFVAEYECTGKEENHLREIVFSKSNMIEFARGLRKVDEFSFSTEMKKQLLVLLGGSSLDPDNRENCCLHFEQIIESEMRLLFPLTAERSMMQGISENIFSLKGEMDELLNNQNRLYICGEQIQNQLSEIRQQAVMRQNMVGQEYQQRSSRSTLSENSDQDESFEWHLALLDSKRLDEDISEQRTLAAEVLAKWREERELFPGWYILPYPMYEKLKHRTTGYEHWIRPGFLPLKQELELCFEYIWRCERGMLLYSSSLQKNIRSIWDLYYADINSSEFQSGLEDAGVRQWYYLGLVLLREYREDGNYQGWQAVFAILQLYEQIDIYSKDGLAIEEIKFAFSRFEMGKVRRLCGKCTLPKKAYQLRLQKIGMEAECGNTKEALRQIEELKSDLQEDIQDSENGTVCLNFKSLYVVSLRMESLLLQGIACAEHEYEKKQEQINTLLNEIERNRSYFDWSQILSEVKISLLEWHTKKYEEKQPFELGRETISIFSAGHACICEESYYLYRVVEAMSVPLVCSHVNLLGHMERPWFEALLEFSPQLAMFMMLRGSSSEHAKYCYSRKNLICLDADVIMFQICCLADIVDKNLDELAELTFADDGVCRQLAENLPEIMIRFMSRCPDELQERMLYLVKQIMEKPGFAVVRDLYRWVYGILRQISEKNKALMIGKLITGDIVEHPVFYRKGMSYDLFEQYFSKTDLNWYRKDCRIEPEAIDWLFQDDRDSLYTWRVKIMRLMCADSIGALNVEQKWKLTEKIWSRIDEKTGLPDFPDLYLWNYMKLEYRDSKVPAPSVKGSLLHHGMMELFGAEEGCQFTFGQIRYLDELVLISRNLDSDFWTIGEVETIFQDALDYWKLLKDKWNSYSGEIDYDEYRTRAEKMVLMMAEVYNNVTVQMSEAYCQQVQAMITELEEREVRVCRLKILFIPEEQKGMFVEELVESFYSEEEKKTIDALQSAYRFIERYPKEEDSGRLIDEMISILRSRKVPGLVQAVITLHNLLYQKNSAYTFEKIKRTDGCLSAIERMSRYEYHMESEKQVKNAALLRKCCASLVFQIALRDDEDGTFPGVRHWQESVGRDEFNEIRNELQWKADRLEKLQLRNLERTLNDRAYFT